MNETKFRELTGLEIAVLERNNCSSVDWSRIGVAEAFAPEGIRNCRFSGTVRIGKNVVIDGVRQSVENYEIGDNVVIIHTESLTATGESTFGGSVRVAVLNEAGGREVPLYNGLTAQIACLSAMYRRRAEAVRAIDRLIDAEVRGGTSRLGTIGAGSYIAHCGALTDMCTGENAVLIGAAELTNGTVNSTADSPTRIGRGVVARDFVTADGAEITDFVQIDRCFIGQGCRLGKGFIATDSLFFANCECEQGEAASVFAGPYTVTHHKSTLLIGGMFSFYNAGSGTNMSNHMYRLGPVHQGILERGCKTGSGSYLLFPARVGAFSTVIGRHDGHSDTTRLPFSCLVERDGKTVVLPGLTLKSVGLARDLRKWPARDRRRGIRRDHIVFEGLNPYTVEQIFGGLGSPEAGRGREIYQTAIDVYFYDMIIERLKSDKTLEFGETSHLRWCDLAGLIAPVAEVERILEALPALHSIHELSLALTGLYVHYDEWAWGYACARMGTADLRAVVERGLKASERMLEWQLADAAKEFSAPMRTGYSPDGDAEFAAVHGTALDHPFLALLRKEFEEKRAIAETFLQTGS
jgi:hypothetical protein